MIPVKPSNAKFTDMQWQAIFDAGHNVLVSASAGSGKTTVLTERIIEKLKSGLSITALLVVTYTEAAAKEMSERIKKAIKQAINETPDSEQRRHLQQQLYLMPQAHISTIHAFCLKVIRRYFYLVNIDPACRLMTDETEILLLKEAVWQQIKSAYYAEQLGGETFTPEELVSLVFDKQQTSTDFERLARAFSREKSDDRLNDLVFSLYEFSRAHPEPNVWLEQLGQLYQVEGSLKQSRLFQGLIAESLTRSVNAWINQLEELLATVTGDERLQKHVLVLQKDRDDMQAIAHALIDANASFDSFHQLLIGKVFDRWPSAAKAKDDAALQDLLASVKAQRDSIKSQWQQVVKKLGLKNERGQIEALSLAGDLVATLSRLMIAFAEAYKAEKIRKHILEFNDLEHLTLEILAPIDAKTGQRQASAAAHAYQQQFAEVMIDEYQDLNKLQETLLYWLSKEATGVGNRFMVGDVKQSIYAFRLADPTLFLDKYQRYQQGNGGERIILAENFRSRGEVISFTNFVFKQLMDVEVGQMAYDHDAFLVQGNHQFDDRTNCHTELLLLETEEEWREEAGETDEQFQINSHTEAEISVVAQTVLRLVNEEGRQFNDIAILTPTRKNNINIQEVFQRYHIPIVIHDAEMYFQRTEIMIMLSLLKIIDNPLQDIPLVSVLRSPIVGLTEPELALIRIADRENYFYQAMRLFITQADSKDAEQWRVAQTLQQFTTRLDRWRTMATTQPLAELIWQIYQETQFLQYVGGLPTGEQRQANLHALYERAQQFEQAQLKGLFQFIRFIEKMQAKSKDLTELRQPQSEQAAVQLMTIHASKGLEFPVVILMDTAKQFNKQDVRQSYVFHETFGVGMKAIDGQQRTTDETLAYYGVAQLKEKKLLAEEMRKLYVALTRAKEKLIIVGRVKDEQQAWERWGRVKQCTTKVLPADARLQAQSFLDWIGQTIVRLSHLSNNPHALTAEAALTDDLPLTVTFVKESSIVMPHTQQAKRKAFTAWFTEQMATPLSLTNDEQQQLATLKAISTYQYPHDVAVQTTSYQAVSELKRLFEDPDLRKEHAAQRYVSPQLAKPKLFQETHAITPAAIGTATHLVMQKIPLDAPVTYTVVAQTIDRLCQQQAFSAAVAERIDRQSILRFFASPFGQQMLAAPHVAREVPFSLLVPAKHLYHQDSLGDDSVLVHGIIDGFFETPEGIVLYDFKTDQIKDTANVETVLLDRYNKQMRIYRLALETIYQKPVVASYICALHSGHNIEIPWTAAERLL